MTSPKDQRQQTQSLQIAVNEQILGTLKDCFFINIFPIKRQPPGCHKLWIMNQEVWTLVSLLLSIYGLTLRKMHSIPDGLNNNL